MLNAPDHMYVVEAEHLFGSIAQQLNLEIQVQIFGPVTALIWEVSARTLEDADNDPDGTPEVTFSGKDPKMLANLLQEHYANQSKDK